MTDNTIILLLAGVVVLAAIALCWYRFSRNGKPRTLVEERSNNRKASTPSNPYLEMLPLGQRRVIPEEEHHISRRHLDSRAMKVVYQLNDGGHEAYLVGGCIRDILMHKRPKDFDVATSALPDVAEQLFRKARFRARLIGRRFRLLHVRFGRDIIEVATFRAGHENGDKDHARQSDSGMILRDNVYGSLEDDALRRDFTINALYYSAQDNCVYDFVNGYPDLKQKTIRMIGDPEERYREDPVRMIRAARFAAKLGFHIDPDTAEPIRRLAPMLHSISPARMFDEVLKLLQTGHGEASLRQLERFNLFEPLFPDTAALLEDDEFPVATLITTALQNTDRRLSQDKSVTPAFLFAALLWYPMLKRFNELRDNKRMPVMEAIHQAANETLAKQNQSTAIPRRFSSPVREIWELQMRLPRLNRADQTIAQPRFRAAYDLLLLRSNSGENDDLAELVQWWSDYQNSDEGRAAQQAQQPAFEEQEKRNDSRRPRRRRPRRRSSSNNSNSNTSNSRN